MRLGIGYAAEGRLEVCYDDKDLIFHSKNILFKEKFYSYYMKHKLGTDATTLDLTLD